MLKIIKVLATKKRVNIFKMILLLYVVLIINSLNTQEQPRVAEEAIQGNPVQFVNRSNRRTSLQVREREINTGKNLAQKTLKEGKAEVNNIQTKRIFDPEKEKYGADIIILTQKTNFGHINAIQRIIQGYLEVSFQYNPKQSQTLSEMLLYYNANLRNNPKKIQDSYSVNVINNIDIKKAGIDRYYYNWSGKTELLIPLRKNLVRPEKTDLDRTEIKEVIEKDKTIPEEKKEELKKIDQELKKEDIKKIEQKQNELVKKEESLKKEEQNINKQEQQLQKQLEDSNKKLEELRKDPEKNKEEIKQEEKKVEQLQEQKKEIQEQKEEVKKEQQQVQEEKKELQEQKKEIQNNQTQITRQEEEKKESSKQPTTKIDEQLEALKKEKEELQKELEKKEQMSDNVINEKIVFLKVIRYYGNGHYNNELWMIDPEKDDTLFRGPFANICSSEYLPIENLGIVVVGYEDSSHGVSPHYLYLLDPQNLTVKAKSREEIIFNSFLVYKDKQIYAIEKYNDKYYLSRFNENLELQTRSSSNIFEFSKITFFKDKIYLTGSEKDGNVPIQVFDRKDLKLLKVIQSPKTALKK